MPLRNNFGGSLSLIEAMRATGVDKIVFSSTCATYRIPAASPIRESVPQLPVNSYGETKLAIERTLHWYGERYGKRSVPLRYFNAAGADSEGEIGELHEPETRLVPLEPTIRRRMERRSTTTFTLRIWPRLIRALEHLCFGRGSTAPRSNLGTAGSFGTRVHCRGRSRL